MRWLVALLALMGYVLGSTIYQTPVRKFESLRKRMIREGTWGEYLKKMNAMRSKSLANGEIHSQQVHDYADNEYLGDITIGTPGQPFLMLGVQPVDRDELGDTSHIKGNTVTRRRFAEGWDCCALGQQNALVLSYQ
ncbi:A1 Propeptide, partial [Ostertagia ostertagi]